MRKVLAILVMTLCAGVAMAQTHPVTGKIVDEKGDPVAFATVKLKSTKSAVSADDNGNFKINAKDNDILVITGTGMNPKEVTVSGTALVTVKMTANNKELSSVVVTALGVKRESKSLGYSAATIDSKDLNSSVPVNAAEGVTGKVSGAIIQQTNSGVDPDNIRITLRGNRSFLGNNEALIVIDNIPSDPSYLAQLNPNDIETFTVLKGATAAALYGSQASNGVVIVTTKQGHKGKPVITVSSAVTFDQLSFIPSEQYYRPSASSEFESTDAISYSNQSNGQNGYVPYENQSFGTPYSAGSPYGTDSVVIGFPGPDGQVQKVAYKPLVNEFKNFWKIGRTLQNGVTYSAGDDISNFYLSALNVNRTDITPDDKYARTNIRANGSKRYGAFRAAANVGYNQTHINQTVVGQTGASQNNSPFAFQTGAAASNFYTQIQNVATQVPFASYSNTNAIFADINTYYNAYALNPYWYIQNQRLNYTRNDVIGNIDLSLDVTKWLNVDYVAGINNEYYVAQQTTAAINFSPYAENFLATLPSGAEAYFVGNQLPHVFNVNETTTKLYSDLNVTLHHQFDNIGAQLILGDVVNQEVQKYVLNGSNTLLNIANFYNVNYREGIPIVDQESFTSRNYGNFADLSLNYNKWIYLHGSVRQDVTSLLNPAYRKYTYPAGDVAVVLSDAIPALKASNTISFLKVSGAVTKVGNISVNPYQVQNVFGAGPGFPYGQTGGLTSSSTYAYSNLKPEFTVSKEVGAEIGVLNNRADFKVSYYDETTTNETVPVNVSPSTGFTSALTNLGQMNNKGLEMDLNFTPLKLQNGFRWDIGIHYTHFINKVVSLGGVSSLYIANSLGTSNSYAVVGQPYATLRVQDWLRDSATGKVIVDPNTGLPSKGSSLVNMGTTNPTHTLGITTSVSYKGFTLSAVAEYRGGNVIYNGTGTALEEDGLSARSAQFNTQRFVYPNSVIEVNGKAVPNTNVTINDGGVGFWGNFGFFPPSMYVTSAAFWTLRNASLTYTVPQKWVEKTKYIQKASLSIVGSNLLLWVPRLNTWTNPEFSEDTGNATGSNSLSQSPATRSYGATLNLTF
jgi:TonB-linked SusC/RagA family outer membrane protein